MADPGSLPPPAPEDASEPRFTARFDPARPPDPLPERLTARTSWPTQGSIWVLTARAGIVAPRRYARATLALLAPDAADDRYTLASGTRLRVVGQFDPHEQIVRSGVHDLAGDFEWVAGRDSVVYEVCDGPSAGIRLELPLGGGDRWPPSALAAHAALRPADRRAADD